MAIKRLNIRISDELHDYFAERSEKTGVSMSSLIALALEEHKMQRETIQGMPNLIDMVNKVERLEKEVKK